MGIAAPGGRTALHRACPLRRTRGPGPGVRVRQQVADARQRPAAQLVVDPGRLGDGMHARHKRIQGELAGGQEVEEATQVAALGPAHVPGRVVDPAQLVAVVVPPRAVGTGEADVQLLLVVGVPREVEPRLADVHDRGPVARQPRRDLDGLVGAAAGGKEHVVDAQSVRHAPRDLLHQRQAFGVRSRTDQRSRVRGELAARGHGVQPDDPDTRSHEDPDDELTDEPEADDAGELAQLRLRAADAVHRDGAHRRERRMPGVDLLRDGDAQVGGHPVDLGVQGELVARRRDQVPDRELLGTRADRDHPAAQGVAERGVAVQPVHRLAVRRRGALLGHAVHELLHLVGTGARLADQGEACLGHLHQLRARGDQ